MFELHESSIPQLTGIDHGVAIYTIEDLLVNPDTGEQAICHRLLLEELEKMWEDLDCQYRDEDEDEDNTYLSYEDIDPEDLNFGDEDE
jgi:hypothetical protein